MNDGGLFVGSTPDIWYFKDTNGDGVADEKKLVFTGFAQGPADSSYGGGRIPGGVLEQVPFSLAAIRRLLCY